MSSLADRPAEEQPDEPDGLLDLDLRQRFAISPPHGRGVCTEPVRFTVPIDLVGQWLDGIIGLVDPDLLRAQDASEPWTFPPIERAGRLYTMESRVTREDGIALVDRSRDPDDLPLLPKGSVRYAITAVVRIPVAGAQGNGGQLSAERWDLDDTSAITDGWDKLDLPAFRAAYHIYGRYLVALITLRPLVNGCTGQIVYLPEVKPWIDGLKSDGGSPWREPSGTSVALPRDYNAGLARTTTRVGGVTVRLPSRPADVMAWRETWRLIRSKVDREDVRLISQWLKLSHDRLPHSEKTVRTIIAAGRAGLLDA